MTNKTFALLVAALLLDSLSLRSQLVETPVFSFEHLSWGLSLPRTEAILNCQNLPQPSLPSNPPGGETRGRFTRYYLDTMFTVRILIALRFSTDDSLLQNVIVSCMAVDTTEGRGPAPNSDVERIGELYSMRLGKTESEKTIPFVGKVKCWSLKRSDVQLLYLSSIASLTIIFAPPSHE